LHISLPPPGVAVSGRTAARAFFEGLAEAYLGRLRKKGVVCFGEKTPAHSGYVCQIRQVFPDGKFLWIYRDGRDVAVSLRKVGWMSPNLAVNFLVWLFYYAKQMTAAKQRGLRILFVKYEKLVREPSSEFSRILAFLGLPFESAVVFGKGNREGILEWEYPWKALACEGITDSRVGSWRNELSCRELQMLEQIGGRALRHLGYEVAAAHSTLFNVLRYPRVFGDLMRLFQRLPFDEVGHQLLGRALCVSSIS
jgi:hypothetical protein